jgi:hypothetical protein
MPHDGREEHLDPVRSLRLQGSKASLSRSFSTSFVSTPRVTGRESGQIASSEAESEPDRQRRLLADNRDGREDMRAGTEV